MIKTLRRKNSIEVRVSMSDNTVEALIEKKRWPPGGLPELQKAIESEIKWVEAVAQQSAPLNQATYSRFMQILCGAAYCFSPQGRVGAIEDLKNSQYQELLREGYVLSSKFKTAAKYGYQPITTGSIFSKLLTFYVNKIRPNMLTQQSDPLLINYTGTKKFLILPAVKQLFNRTLGLHMTTTNVRSLVETTMHKMQVCQATICLL